MATPLYLDWGMDFNNFLLFNVEFQLFQKIFIKKLNKKINFFNIFLIFFYKIENLYILPLKLTKI